MAGRHAHAPWRKLVLIPFWILQILFMALMIVSLTFEARVIAGQEVDYKERVFPNSDDFDVTDSLLRLEYQVYIFF